MNKSLSNDKYYKKIKSIKNILKLNKYNLIINTEYSNLYTKKFFNKKIAKTYDSYAYTTTINHENINNTDAIQIFTKLGPLAFYLFQK